MNAPDRYACPCCGYRTYLLPADGTMQICPVCFWEDSPGEYYWSGSNQVTRAMAQRNFATFGASEVQFLDLVRSPSMDESRSESWLSFDKSCAQIIGFIETAFHDVKLDGGVTLHQREALDDYCSGEEFLAAAKMDPETRWQDIPRTRIEKLGVSLVFLDPEGIRFHLPAFMRCALQLWQESEYADFSSSDMLIYGLDSGPCSTGYYEDSFLLLNTMQNQAVAAYLAFVAAGESYEDDAAKALSKGWGDWIPDFISLPSR